MVPWLAGLSSVPAGCSLPGQEPGRGLGLSWGGGWKVLLPLGHEERELGLRGSCLVGFCFMCCAFGFARGSGWFYDSNGLAGFLANEMFKVCLEQLQKSSFSPELHW